MDIRSLNPITLLLGNGFGFTFNVIVPVVLLLTGQLCCLTKESPEFLEI